MAKTLRSQGRGPGFDPAQTTRSQVPQLKIPRAATKTWHSQIFFKKPNTFPKGIAAINSDSSGGSGQNQWKIFCKVFSIRDVTKNIHDSWEEVRVSTLTGVWNKLIPVLMGDSEGFKTSVQMWQREQEKVEPKDGPELLQSQDKT